ncbi:MAG: NAD(P)H-hydrate epimerase [Candidatus Omnitrophota bacterium]
MAEIDRKAQEEYGIPQIDLMENAGRSVAEVILSENAPIKNEKIACFCGKGNNGGDGFVIARYLAKESPAHLTIYAADTENIKQGAALQNFRIISEMDIEVRRIEDFISDAEVVEGYSISIDALFGTGFKGELAEEYSRLGKMLNASKLRRYAVDIPSGLDSTTGVASENCLIADKTVTFGLPKQGFFLADGPRVCGEVVVSAHHDGRHLDVVVRNVGFPEELLREYA